MDAWFPTPDARAYLLIASAATLLLLAGLLVEAAGWVGEGLRRLPRIALLLAAVAAGAWFGLALVWAVQLPADTAARMALVAGLIVLVAANSLRRRLGLGLRHQPPAPAWIGLGGEVYRRIPRGGHGLVRLAVGGRTLVAAARAEADVPAFVAVRVVAVEPDCCVVEPVRPAAAPSPPAAAGPS